ncbi:succinyldiaminopimelate transaminase [Sulfuriferula sp. AH1]|uniref:succinyldiaminopimelate transaminase n=1 Tax=Sulfuriferula sp. AH1 TaxID=1985873 RepID=UPI000B3B36D7|nr:succinyldiaminopimelate transaminase [Sulfuriferula sp. AH1]ARU31576.1 succinyldiaminopimelate transaminase [Sulfuriferula sp. AH1]
MNPYLDLLQPYPFQKLRELFAGITPSSEYTAINLSIGEPKHATPAFIKEALIANLDGLASYPLTAGLPTLRLAISNWIARRYDIPAPNPETQILPVNGSREALFAFAQTIVDPCFDQPVVISPNPFYQIYEGAALLAGAQPYYLPTLPENGYRMDFTSVPESVLARTQLIYVCSPGNPTGRVMTLEEWRALFALSDRYGFAIAADECYSEIYFDEAHPPLGAMQAAQQLGRTDYRNLVVFSSLSKRSNVPGMRSGFVAGDAAIIAKFLLYRTYHGSAMSPSVQMASVAAWNDEAHVVENRRLYAEKFAAVQPMLNSVMPAAMPDAAFYLWIRVPHGDDAAFARKLYQDYHVTVLPGSFLARDFADSNPGAGFIRIALVASLAECVDAATRIQQLITHTS